MPMLPPDVSVTFRLAYPDDELAIVALAALDEQPVPTGTVLVAEVAGELWAAASIDGKGAIADPFHPSGELLALLVERADRLRHARSGRAKAAARRRPAADEQLRLRSA